MPGPLIDHEARVQCWEVLRLVTESPPEWGRLLTAHHLADFEVMALADQLSRFRDQRLAVHALAGPCRCEAQALGAPLSEHYHPRGETHGTS